LKIAIVLCDVALSAAFAIVVNWLGLIPFRRSKGKHWTERARVLYPARKTAAWEVWLIPAIVVLGQRLAGNEDEYSWMPVAFSSWLGVLLGSYFLSRELFPSITVREWFHEMVVRWGLAVGWWTLFIAIAYLMPTEVGWMSWLLAGIYLAGVAGWAFGGLIWCLKKCRRLKPAPENLRRIVSRVSDQTKVPIRGVWVLQGGRSSASAMPYTRELLFSETLLTKCPEEEIASICAHELGHCCESRTVLFWRLSRGVAFLPLLFVKPILRVWGVGGAFFAVGAYWVSALFLQKFSHAMELRADKIAREHEEEPGVYARALARIYEDNLIPAVTEHRQTHPHLYDRLVSAGVAPDYPRPEPADGRSFLRYFLWVVIFILAAQNAFHMW
jgi:Zn-dependent protease with chaperone function